MIAVMIRSHRSVLPPLQNHYQEQEMGKYLTWRKYWQEQLSYPSAIPIRSFEGGCGWW